MTDDLLKRLRAAQEVRDEHLKAIGGCSDGHCVILKPNGMHTNGGCRCWRDGLTMQRFAHASNRFAQAIRAALGDKK